MRGRRPLIILIGVALKTPRSPSPSVDAWIVPAIHAAFIGLAINSVNADIMHFRFLWIGLAMVRSAVAGPSG